MATVTKPILLDETGQAILSKLNEVSILPQIVDNCTTAAANKALSANQGKQLLDTINGTTNYIARGNVSSGNLNNLISCGTYNCDNCTNLPYTYAKVVVESDAAGSWIKQTATSILSPYQSCYRIKNGSEPWSAWIGDSSAPLVGSLTSNYNSTYFYAPNYSRYVVKNGIAHVSYDIYPKTDINNYVPLLTTPLPFTPVSSYYTNLPRPSGYTGDVTGLVYIQEEGNILVNRLSAGYLFYASFCYPCNYI